MNRATIGPSINWEVRVWDKVRKNHGPTISLMRQRCRICGWTLQSAVTDQAERREANRNAQGA